jgi:hypothetical protein
MVSVTPMAICDNWAMASGAARRAVSAAWRDNVGGLAAALEKPDCVMNE